jgi:hypothetical protein
MNKNEKRILMAEWTQNYGKIESHVNSKPIII